MVRRFRPSLPTLPALPERWSWARRRRLYIAAALSALLIAPTGVYALFTVLRSIGGNSFSVSSCLHSSVKGVQRGTTINSANGTQTVTISSVDPTKAFLQFSTASNSNRPVGSTIRGRLASATTLEFVRVTDETSPATINITWNLVEYLCGVSVQRGSVTQTTTTTDVSITPVPATNRSFLMWSKTGDPAETDWASGQQTVGELTGTSSLQFRTRATPAGPVAGWYSGWSYRKQITLTAGQISGSLTNFPVLISISDANLAGGAQAGGNDIVFTDGDGTTKLDHEIESYASGTLVAWVRKPTLSAAANTMYMYYGNAGAGSQQNAAGVWNPTYQAVWHLNQTPSDTLNNDLPSSVTATADPATSQGSMASTNPVAGQIGSGLTFNGTSQYLSTSYQQAGPQAFTLEAWFRTTDASASQKGKIIGLDDVQTGTSSTNYGSMMYLGNDGKLGGGVYDGTT